MPSPLFHLRCIGIPILWYKTFSSKQKAIDCAKEVEGERENRVNFLNRIDRKKTLKKLIDRYIEFVPPEKPKNATNVEQHLVNVQGVKKSNSRLIGSEISFFP